MIAAMILLPFHIRHCIQQDRSSVTWNYTARESSEGRRLVGEPDEDGCSQGSYGRNIKLLNRLEV
jgi:hypothetical protein